jgi:GAF domain-containing protein
MTLGRLEKRLARRGAAVAEGLDMAAAFPIAVASEILGVMELYRGAGDPPSDATLQALTTLGAEIAAFVERSRAERERGRLMREAAPADRHVLMASCR